MVAHPILWSRVLKNEIKDKKVIVINPRRSETACNSDIWIDLKPKSDLYLIYAIANVLIENNWIDEEFIEIIQKTLKVLKNILKNMI